MTTNAPTLGFVKMQALGNDYVVLHAQDVERACANVETIAPRVCDRRQGVGADGVIILDPRPSSADADASMRIVNADGSLGGRCGNGLRCAARLLAESAVDAKRAFRIDVGDAVVEARVERDAHGAFAQARVDMGRPAFALDALPAAASTLRATGALRTVADASGSTLCLWRPEGVELEGALVSMGNPHLVFLASHASVADRDVDALMTLGAHLEQHAAFPQRVNVHLACVRRCDALELASWERGVGATPACGTGACAAVAAATALNLVKGAVNVAMPGGSLVVEMRAGSVRMTGDAQRVFEGVYPLA